MTHHSGLAAYIRWDGKHESAAAFEADFSAAWKEEGQQPLRESPPGAEFAGQRYSKAYGDSSEAPEWLRVMLDPDLTEEEKEDAIKVVDPPKPACVLEAYDLDGHTRIMLPILQSEAWTGIPPETDAREDVLRGR